MKSILIIFSLFFIISCGNGIKIETNTPNSPKDNNFPMFKTNTKFNKGNCLIKRSWEQNLLPFFLKVKKVYSKVYELKKIDFKCCESNHTYTFYTNHRIINRLYKRIKCHKIKKYERCCKRRSRCY